MKKTGLCVAVLFVVFGHALADDGLVAYYPFASNALDQSGNGNHGTLLGGASVTDRLALGYNILDALSLPNTVANGLTDFTFSAILKINSLHANHWINGANALDHDALSVTYISDQDRWAITINNSTSYFANNTAMEDLRSHHVIILRNGVTARLYVDGAEAGSGISVIGAPLKIDPNSLIVGQDQDTEGYELHQSWAGEVDNLRFYNKALSEGEVRDLYLRDTIGPQPIAYAGLDAIANCEGTAQIGGNPTASDGTPPYSYSWSPEVGLNDATIANPIAAPSSTTEYVVTVTDANNRTDADTVTVTVVPPPLTDAGIDATIAPGGSVQIGGNPTGLHGTAPYTYTWSPNTGLDNANAANPYASPASTTEYVVVITDASGCTDSDTMIVTVTASLSASAGVDQEICTGQSVEIGGSPTGSGGAPPYNYSWSPSSGLDNATTANPIAAPSTTTEYIVAVTDANNQTDMDTVAVTVNSPPVADAGTDRMICIGETITLGGSPTSSGNGPFTYSWDPATGLDDATSANPQARPTSSTTYAVTVTNANGCQSSDEVTINVHEYTLLANRYIKINKNLESDGNIHSNEKISFGAGYPGVHTGDLSAVGDISIRTQNTIVGNVHAGDDLYLVGDATVTGDKSENANVAPIPPPVIQFSGGGADLFVPQNGAKTLAPGAYNQIKVKNSGTLYFTSGDYFINLLDTDGYAVLSFDVTNGPVNVHVVTELDLANGMQVVISGAGAATDQVSFITLRDAKVDIGKSAIIRGAFIVQNGEVHLSKGAKFRGSICADAISIDAEVKFQFHNSGAAFPKPGELVDLGDEEIEDFETIVTDYCLEQNYPNPFNPTTSIRFALPETEAVTLAIYNSRGQLVRNLISRNLDRGWHSVVWNAKDDQGQRVTSGVYPCVLKAGEFVQERKLVLMK